MRKRGEAAAGADQCFGEAGIVIGEPGFEPVPVGTPRAFPPRGKKCAAALDDRARRGVAGTAVEQMIGAQQSDVAGARALELIHHRSGPPAPSGRTAAQLGAGRTTGAVPRSPARASLSVFG